MINVTCVHLQPESHLDTNSDFARVLRKTLEGKGTNNDQTEREN